ncbi:MAG: hypothetical protein HYW86_04815 [Candidatus Roizmanbacteria bacterium]|nr:MAG: hypothetical protein HYW86_04815 [Candidatus Roizmanbacteria bacterium]
MKYKIGVYGSAVSEDLSIDEKARNLGQILGDFDITLITGACTGLPYTAASAAFKKGVEVVGFSPEKDMDGQKKFTPHDDLSIYSKINFTPKDFEYSSLPKVCQKYRNVISTSNCDGAIIISGRWGTMNEFTNLFDMGKVIGVLTGTGGIADELVSLFPKINKPGKGKVIFDADPQNLVQKVLDELKLRK